MLETTDAVQFSTARRLIGDDVQKSVRPLSNIAHALLAVDQQVFLAGDPPVP